MTNTMQLLSVEEQEVCQKIAAQDVDTAGQRAVALLAINGGSTQTQASEQTGLTLGQIRYLVTTFRKKRLAIFPDDVLSQAQSEAEASTKTAELAKNEALSDDNASSNDEVKQISEKVKKKTKKAKKNKKDNGKKSKKDKGKKGKKSKKDNGKKAGKKKSKK